MASERRLKTKGNIAMSKTLLDGGMRVLTLLASAMLLVYVVITANEFFQQYFNRPFTFISMVLADPQPVKPGATVTFLSKRDKHRKCQVLVDQFVSLTQEDGANVIPATVGTATPILQRTTAGGYSGLGVATVPVKIPVPATAPDGLYTFSQVIRSICDGHTYTDTTAQVHFRVKK